MTGAENHGNLRRNGYRNKSLAKIIWRYLHTKDYTINSLLLFRRYAVKHFVSVLPNTGQDCERQTLHCSPQGREAPGLIWFCGIRILMASKFTSRSTPFESPRSDCWPWDAALHKKAMLLAFFTWGCTDKATEQEGTKLLLRLLPARPAQNRDKSWQLMKKSIRRRNWI